MAMLQSLLEVFALTTGFKTRVTDKLLLQAIPLLAMRHQSSLRERVPEYMLPVDRKFVLKKRLLR